jgi:corticotropin releasing hormone receptor 1
VSIGIGQILFLTVQTYAGTNLVACTIGGALIHYFFLTNFFWCFCLAFNFYQLIVKRNSQTRALEKYYHLIGWGVPFVFVILLGALQNYGRIGNGPSYGCYITSGTWVLIGFFIPGVLMVAANAVLFFFVASEIHGTLSKAPETEQKRKENSKEMRVLISIFVTVGLSWIFGFFISLVSTVFVLYQIIQIFFTVTAPLQGFFIFVAYCINKKVINRWKGRFGCKVDETDQTSATASSRGGNSGTTATRSAASQSGRVD